MNWLVRRIFFSLLLLIGIELVTHAQGNINAMEYFIDNGDLGVGANTSIPITNGATISESFVIPKADFPGIGFHTIYFRIQDAGGQWSLSESRSFYVSESNLTTQADIVNVEYFIDTDPGSGSGISLGAFASNTVTLNPIIPTNGLPTGFHVLYTRSLDSDGIWSNLESRSFYISQSDCSLRFLLYKS